MKKFVLEELSDFVEVGICMYLQLCEAEKKQSDEEPGRHSWEEDAALRIQTHFKNLRRDLGMPCTARKVAHHTSQET